MPENITPSQIDDVTNGNSKITYEQFGKDHAQNANATPNQVRGSLNIIYNEIVRDAKLSDEQKGMKRQALSKEKEIAEKQKIDKEAEVQNKETEIAAKQKEIDDIEQGRGHVDMVPFIISAIITLLLTFFLWTFYSAAGYAAFNGVKDGMTGFKAVFGALDDLALGSGFIKATVVLFPAIFIGLGFLIHDSLEKKKPLIVLGLIAFTFCFDAIIGYLITSEIYTNDYAAKRVLLPWEPSMIFSAKGIDFFLILASGFVSYIMWGFLLNSTLNRYKDMQPTVRQQQLNRDIAEIRKAIITLSGEKNQLENKIKLLIQDINDISKDLVYISISGLKAKMGYFMSGWGQYVNMMRGNEAPSLIKEANEIADVWLQEKINNLKSSVNEGIILINK